MSSRNVSRRAALIAGAAGLATLPFAGSPAFAANTGPKVYLDPGHGGTDSGAVGNGLKEKWLTLAIARITRDQLLKHNYRVRMSRNSDVYPTLPERANDANSWGASIFVSIHINSADNIPTANGFESFRSPYASARTVRLQNQVHSATLNRMRTADASIPDRRMKTAEWYVLLNTNMSAVLTENLFISNVHDANLLKQDSFKQKVGLGHAFGIRRFFGENV